MGGKFVISLDFELMWGVRDKRKIDEYGENVKGVHTAIPRLLRCFDERKVKATFSTVGFLFCESKNEMLGSLPDSLPEYNNRELSPYNGYFNLVGENYQKDLYHFAPELIKEIQKYPEQEIGTHTFSHYYCLEEGQTAISFKADIEAAISVAKKFNLTISSIVFPRNQVNPEYLQICSEHGIICYRGNQDSWLYEERNEASESKVRRVLRLVDAYFNISGHHCFSSEYMKRQSPLDIPASRFLRPFSRNLRWLDGFRLQRIKSGMTYAAKNNLMYHLWWHPHNFGVNQDENFAFLDKILSHYQSLNKLYKFESITMSNLAISLK